VNTYPADYWDRRKAELHGITVQQMFDLLRTQQDLPREELALYAQIARERVKRGEETCCATELLQETDRLLKAPLRIDTAVQGEGPKRKPGESPAADAELVFRKDLPGLLATRAGQWVAYHGTRQVGFGRTDIELYRRCQELQLPVGEYIVRPIEPLPPDVIHFMDDPVL
jgi:hypothetical protein